MTIILFFYFMSRHQFLKKTKASQSTDGNKDDDQDSDCHLPIFSMPTSKSPNVAFKLNSRYATSTPSQNEHFKYRKNIPGGEGASRFSEGLSDMPKRSASPVLAAASFLKQRLLQSVDAKRQTSTIFDNSEVASVQGSRSQRLNQPVTSLFPGTNYL